MLLTGLVFITALQASSQSVPESAFGARQPGIEAALRSFQDKNDIPGLCFTVSFRDRLVYAFSRGWADKENGAKFGPRTKCALASISMVPSAFALIKLLDKKGISLDSPALKYLKMTDDQAQSQIAKGYYPRITFRHLLQHSAGFDDSFTPWSRPEVAKAFDGKTPSTARQNVMYELRKPLPRPPGAKYEYSNFGYVVIGRLIEDIGEKPYADLIQQEVFEPLGVGGWVIRNPHPDQQYLGECHYYSEPDVQVPSDYPEDGNAKVPVMYGGAAFEQADACSAWVADSVSLASFASALASSRIGRILSVGDISQIVRRPNYAGNATQFKGLGLDIERSADGQQFCFRYGGLLPGASSWFSSNFAGVVMTLVMNKGIDGRELSWEIHQQMMDAICAKNWDTEFSTGLPLGRGR